MLKIFVKNNQINEKEIIVDGENYNHIKNVLRLKQGEQLQICDIDTRKNYICSINKILKDSICCNISQNIENSTEPNIYINIIQGIPKGDKMEWIIEKCTEIGVSEFTPIKMERCISKIGDAKTKEKKLSRWKKIAESASMQSKRDIIPNVKYIENFNELNDLIKEYDLVLVAYEEEKNITIKEKLKEIKNSKTNNIKIAVIIGPEGRNKSRRNNKDKEMEYSNCNIRKKNFKNRNCTNSNFKYNII